MGDRVEAAVQLTHGDGLGIDDAVHGAELVKGASSLKIAQGISQHLVAHRFAAQRLPHDHQTVTHQDHLIHLNTSIIAPVTIVISVYLAHTPETATWSFFSFLISSSQVCYFPFLLHQKKRRRRKTTTKTEQKTHKRTNKHQCVNVERRKKDCLNHP